MTIQPTTEWKNKFLIGEQDGQEIWLSPPSWDCDWYWGFGYLGNFNCHYHLDGLGSSNLYDNIKEHFKETLLIKEKDLWIFCELVKSAYILKESAEFFGRGGSNYTLNPCQNILQDTKQADKINQELLPAIFAEIKKILDNQFR